jgi:hypothetical protein
MRKKKQPKRYILTDSCYWYGKKKGRSPHFIEIVCLKTGTVKQLKSGSVITIVKEEK